MKWVGGRMKREGKGGWREGQRNGAIKGGKRARRAGQWKEVWEELK